MVPCEVAYVGAKIEMKAETEEVVDGKWALIRLYSQME